MVNDTNRLTASNPKMTIIMIRGITASCFAEKQVSLPVFLKICLRLNRYWKNQFKIVDNLSSQSENGASSSFLPAMSEFGYFIMVVNY